MRRSLILIGPIFLFAVLFLAGVFLAKEIEPSLVEYLNGRESRGLVFYVIFIALGVVVAPISAIAVLPVVVKLYGILMASLASAFGWTVGAIGAFFLARRYGLPLVKHFVSKEKIDRIEKFLVGKRPFLKVFVLRVFFPVDILSYALGLLPHLSFKTYLWATILGVLPFAFIFSYLSEFSFNFFGF